jgi:site-specific DNA recombinase
LVLRARDAQEEEAMRVGVYLRISKDDEGDGLGVARQEKECRALVKSRGWEVAEVYPENNRSAYNGTRTEWSRMLADLDAGTVEGVVSWANDRLYRRVRDQLDLLERGKPVVTVRDGELDPSSEAGRMTMGILANVAEFESARKSSRHVSQHRQIAEAGTWPGGRVPYGYRKDGKSLQVEESEAKQLREAAASVLDGATLRSVADSLGMYTRTAKRTLMNETIAGRRIYNGQELKAAWDPILDVRTWRRVYDILDDPARGDKGPRPKYLLSGIVVCGTCGLNLKGHPQRGSKAYSCLNKDCERWAQLRASVLDEFVWDLAGHRTPKGTEVQDPKDVPESRELDALDDRLGVLAERFADGALSDEAYSRAVRAVEKKREALEAKVAKRAVRTMQVGRHRVPVYTDKRGNHYTSFEPVESMSKREHLERVIERVILNPAGRNNRMPVESRVKVEWR